METKVCNKCNVEKDVMEFQGMGKVCKTCKTCREKKKIENKIYRENNKEIISLKKKVWYENNKGLNQKKRKEYYQKNKEEIKRKSKKWYENNKERSKEYHTEYRKNNRQRYKKSNQKWYENNKELINKKKREHYQNNKEKESDRVKKWYGNNKEWFKEYRTEYRKNNIERLRKRDSEYLRNKREVNPLFKLSSNIRTYIRASIIKGGYSKKSRTFEILGCSYEELKEHIESQFEDWMNWDNYGIYNGKEKCGWDLDHIVPVSSAECEEDIIRLNHYSNIQPLCSYINRDVKRDNIDWES